MPRDAMLDVLGSECDRVKEKFRIAKDRVGGCKADLDRARPEYGRVKSEIASVSASIASEREAAHICYAAGDHYNAKLHSYNIQNMKPRINALHDSRQRLYENMESAKASFNEALEEKRRIGAELDEAWSAFNRRLEEVRTERERERAKWREKPCKGCGRPVRYNIEWAHPPNYCKECKDKFARERAVGR